MKRPPGQAQESPGLPGASPVDASLFVVGGGPAGALAALLLSRQGWDVELVDRGCFPRPKACGECVNPAGVRLLEELGLLPMILEDEPRRLSGWDLSSPDGGVASGYFARGDWGLGVRRQTLDHTLIRAARQEGVVIHEGMRLTDVDPGGPLQPARVQLQRRGSRQVESRSVRFVIGADGLQSTVARSLGLVRRHARPGKASLTWRVRGHGPPRDRGRLILGQGVTVGLAPVDSVGDSSWNATLVVSDPAALASLQSQGWTSLLGAMERAQVPWTHPPEITHGPWGAGAFHRSVSRRVQGRVVLIGDAAGYYDPLTGQGIYRALRAGQTLAQLFSKELPLAATPRLSPGDLSTLHGFHPPLAQAARKGALLQRAIEVVTQHPIMRGTALAGLRAIPGVTSGLIRLTGDRPSTFLAPSISTGTGRSHS